MLLMYAFSRAQNNFYLFVSVPAAWWFKVKTKNSSSMIKWLILSYAQFPFSALGIIILSPIKYKYTYVVISLHIVCLVWMKAQYLNGDTRLRQLLSVGPLCNITYCTTIILMLIFLKELFILPKLLLSCLPIAAYIWNYEVVGCQKSHVF